MNQCTKCLRKGHRASSCPGWGRRLALVALLAMLAACGGGDPEPDKTTDKPACGAPGVCV